MIKAIDFFKPLLKTDKKIGLVFVHHKGLALQIRSSTGGSLRWHQFISFERIGPDHKAADLAIPKVSHWILIVPAYQCIIKYVVFPSADPAEIEKMLEFELPNIVSYNTQPWAWDCLIVHQQPTGASETMTVLSPLRMIDHHIKTLSSLSIKPDVVTISAAFYTLLLNKSAITLEAGLTGCFYFDDDYMDFFLIENGQLTFLRGIQMRKEFHENTRLLETEIRRSVGMLKEYRHRSYPDKFLVVDTNNSSADSVKIVEKVLNNSVEKVELQVLYKGHSWVSDGIEAVEAHDYLLPGAGKIWINLLPKYLKEKRLRSNKRKQMILHALKICFVLLLAFLCLKTSLWRKSRLLKRYEQRLSAISPMAEKLQFLQQQLSVIENQLHGNVSTLDVIAELYRALPEDITVHYLSIGQNKKIVARAQAKLLSQAFDCIGLLEQSSYFGNVRQSYANQRLIGDSILIDFEITADLQKAVPETKNEPFVAHPNSTQ